MLEARLRRLVDVREGELRIAVSSALTLALIIAGHTILETARDALFLGSLSADRLPFVYLLLAATSLGAARISTAFSRRFGRRNALIFALLGCGYGTALLHARPMTPPTVFALYLWSGLLGTVLVLQFWMLAGQVFSVAQGKRLFGPIAAGGVLGAVFGAAGSALALELFEVQHLLLVASGLFAVTGLFLTTLTVDEHRAPTDARTSDVGSKRSALRDGYIRRVALLVVFSTATVLTTDYLFKTVAAAEVSAHELGGFFARYYAGLNAIALLIQVGVTSRLVRRLGVAPALTVLPVLISVLGMGAALAGGALGAVLLVKGADGALRHSLHRVTSELLLLPLSAEQRDQAKPLLDTICSRGTQALTAGFILGLTTLGWATPRILPYIVVGLAVVWLIIAIDLRRPYIDLFRRALTRGGLGSPVAEVSLSNLPSIMEALSSRDENRVLAALEILVEAKHKGLIPGLILYHESETVLIRALEVIAEDGRADWVPLSERLLTHPSAAVRGAAVRALAAAGYLVALRKGLSDKSAAVRAEAAFFIVHQDPDADPCKDPTIRSILDMPGVEGTAARRSLLDMIRDFGDDRWLEPVAAALETDGDALAGSAAAVLERLPDERFLSLLISRLGVRNGRDAVRRAIAAIGPAAHDALCETLRDPTVDRRIREQVPRALARFGTQSAVDTLVEVLESELPGLIRFKALQALSRMRKVDDLEFDPARFEREATKNAREYLRLLALGWPLENLAGDDPVRRGGSGEVLRGLLQDKLKQSLERLFMALQLAHPNEDLRPVHSALRQPDKARRANANEFLDALLSGSQSLRKLVQLVVDDLPTEERLRRIPAVYPEGPKAAETYEEAVARLLEDEDETLAALAAYHALDLGLLALHERVLDAFERRPALRKMAALSLQAA